MFGKSFRLLLTGGRSLIRRRFRVPTNHFSGETFVSYRRATGRYARPNGSPSILGNRLGPYCHATTGYTIMSALAAFALKRLAVGFVGTLMQPD